MYCFQACYRITFKARSKFLVRLDIGGIPFFQRKNKPFLLQTLAGIVFVTYLCKKIHHARIIQTIRFHLLFFSREPEPIHVHVRGDDGDAKFNWDGEGFVMEYAHNIKNNDLKRIERMIAENTDIIINRWYELFKTDNEDNQ